MVTPRHVSDVRVLMAEFGDRTGLTSAARAPRRYLWTDAFAVCNYLSLFGLTQEASYLGLATRLVDQVHETLGRHRPDAARTGWISGLDEATGRRHPTAGGLRIGKPLDERPPGQPPHQREEWDRDGQYFHYLTQWMLALMRTAVVTANPDYCRFAIELAQAAQAAFAYEDPRGGGRRMYWKMSIDLSRPQVSSMGHHDPLAAFVSYSALEDCRVTHFPDAALPDLRAEIAEAAAMCAGRDWSTDDPLGIGGVLVDACRLAQMSSGGVMAPGVSTERLLTDARVGLAQFVSANPFDASANVRLAFRELGLAIGLHAVEALHRRMNDGDVALTDNAAREVGVLVSVCGIAEQIETFWRNPASQSATTWQAHLDINSVMLATSLLGGSASGISNTVLRDLPAARKAESVKGSV